MPADHLDPRIELGQRLARYREARKLTVDGLAAVGELDPSNIRSIEKGANPRLVTVLKIACVLEIDLGELFAGIDPYALPEDLRRSKASEMPESYWRPKDRIA